MLPVEELYQVTVLGVGGVPVRVAVSVVDWPAQMDALVAVMLKFVVVALFVPGQPRVAPLGGNSVSPPELVVPLLPPFAFRVIAPAAMAICPPPPPPPGPSASKILPK